MYYPSKGNPPCYGNEKFSPKFYYVKNVLTTLVVNCGEKHWVYIFRSVNLMLIAKLMDMRRNGNDIRFCMLLKYTEAFELRTSVGIGNTSKDKLA